MTHAADPLQTVSERSGFKVTGRHDEVIALCAAFERACPDTVRCFEFGRSPEGRPMLALAVSRSGALSAEAARDRRLPVLLVQGGIHSGEIDGKDAGFLALREVLEGRAAQGALERQVWLFVPVFSVDGHERFGAWNRPNQVGPEEMGWRTTAQNLNLNLNRDYMKADAPEMQAMLKLIETWDPVLTADLHVTDGARFEHDVSIQVEPFHSGDAELRELGGAVRDAVIDRLAGQGSLPLPFYPSFVVDDDPASGFADDAPLPRFSNGYFPLRNRFGMLVETHSWKDYPTRVRITCNVIVNLLELTARDGGDWRAAMDAADRRAAQLAGQVVPLTYGPTAKSRIIEFRGYAYTREPSAISGGLVTRYDPSSPEIWRLPLRDEMQPLVQVKAPDGGYLVPAAEAGWLGERLALHGIAFERLRDALAEVDVETFRATQVEFAAASFEGRTALTLQGAWASEGRAIAAGSLWVPIAQSKARLAMALLEPRAPDSFAAWGFFNAAFERKEYMEAYVAEDVAKRLLAENPALARVFRDRLAEDAAFAASPAARLEFFERRHPSWDERYRLYPVLRAARRPG